MLHCETELTLVVYRTQLFNPGDIDNVKKVQAGYKVQPLSAFLGTAAPKAAPAIDFIKPITHDEEKTSLLLMPKSDEIQFTNEIHTQTKPHRRRAYRRSGAARRHRSRECG